MPESDFATSADGTRIAYDKIGNGPALIHVGGATVVKLYVKGLADALSSNFTVYTYDRRGRGGSNDIQPYTVEREIEDLAALIKVAGDKAFVFGHSSGGTLALRAAASGLPISKLAVYEPPMVVDGSRPPLPKDYVEKLNSYLADGKPGEAAAWFFTAAVEMPPQIVWQMRTHPGWAMTESVANTIPYDGMIVGDTMSGKPLSDEPWNKVTMPTLVLDGGASPEWMRNGAKDLVRVLPNPTHKTLEGQNHGPADNVLAPALDEFFLGGQ